MESKAAKKIRKEKLKNCKEVSLIKHDVQPSASRHGKRQLKKRDQETSAQSVNSEEHLEGRNGRRKQETLSKNEEGPSQKKERNVRQGVRKKGEADKETSKKQATGSKVSNETPEENAARIEKILLSLKMITSNFKDSDGYKLQFEEQCPESDRKYFMQQYPKVDNVASKKLHCTTCDVHIGTAPIAEKIIRTHQILSVTQCNTCFAFYNSGEFGKGEDGSEYYCRWCGQGGEVFCCATCPYVFCNKCIRSNLSNSYVKEIEENDDWSCFVCNREVLKNHRAQHWALRNYMNKQLQTIQKSDCHDEAEVNNLLNEDSSKCCPRKKRKSMPKPVAAPVKRPSPISRDMTALQPQAKKANIQAVPKVLPKVTIPSKSAPRPSPSSKNNNSEIVCTPDIMGMLGDNDDSIIPTTNMMPSTSIAPPPLIMRNNQVRMTRPTLPSPSPIYHNVNGFQIDLNHAARQEIFRLPNGKLIQVRKQTGVPALPQFRPGIQTTQPRQPQFTIRQAPDVSNRTYRPQMRPRTNAMPRQRFSFNDGRIVATPVLPSPPATQIPPATPVPPAPAKAPTNGSSMCSVFTQQSGSIAVARAPQPNTPFGKAKTEFEDKIISGMEICQHTINKMITLTNSSSFKQSHTFSDIKDLYIHLEYLFSYTSDKFKTLQENLKTGKESLAVHDVTSKEKCDKDELEIVEERTDVIEVLSDDEEENVEVTLPPHKEKERPAVLAPSLAKRPLLKHIQYTAEEVSPSPALASAPENEQSTQNSSTTLSVESSQEEVVNDLTDETIEAIESDKKLKKKVVVKVEKLENTKNPIIKQFMSQLAERLEKQSVTSPELSQDSIFSLEFSLSEQDVEKDSVEIVDEAVEKLPDETGVNDAEPVVTEIEATVEKESEKCSPVREATPCEDEVNDEPKTPESDSNEAEEIPEVPTTTRIVDDPSVVEFTVNENEENSEIEMKNTEENGTESSDENCNGNDELETFTEADMDLTCVEEVADKNKKNNEEESTNFAVETGTETEAADENDKENVDTFHDSLSVEPEKLKLPTEPKISKRLKEVESLFHASKDVLNIDDAPPIELMEVDESEISAAASASVMELTVETISSDEDNPEKILLGNPKEVEFDSVISIDDGSLQSTIIENHIQNAAFQKSGVNSFEKMPDVHEIENDLFESDISSRVKTVQGVIDDDEMLMDDFFDGLEEHIM